MATSTVENDPENRTVGRISPICSNCIETGSAKAARCFCQECDQARCGTCEGLHRKLASSHEIELYNEEVSRVDKQQSTVSCSVHTRQETTLFCEDHHSLVCLICKDGDHNACSVQPIADVCGKFDVPKEICQILDELTKTNDEAEKLRRVKQLMLAECNAQIDDYRHAIISLRRKFSIMFDRYETQLMSKGGTILGSLKSSVRIVGNLSERLNAQIKCLEGNTENIDKEVSFKHLMIAKAKFKKFNDDLDEVRAKTTSYDISIDEDKSLPNLIDELSGLVRHEIKDSDEIPFVETTGQPMKRSFLKMKSCAPIKETDPNVRSDNKEADIFGCCWLPDGNGLIVCDHENKALKLFDKDMHVKFTAICSSNPYDVCCIDKTKAVVTLPNTKEIQFVTVYPGFKFIEKKDLKLVCYGVAVYGQNIFVCVKEPSSMMGVKVLMLNGDDVCFIPHIGPGYPRQISLDRSGNIFYTGGYASQMFINCVTKDGHGIYSVSSKDLYNPYGITCDTEGNVLVCDRDKTCVQAISSAGDCGDIAIRDKEYRPTAMCINKDYNILAIAYRKSTGPINSKLILYKLEYA